MTEKRLIVRDDDYAWVDTVTDTVIEVEDAFDLVNALHEENEKLKKEIEYWKKHCITHGIAVPITWGDKND